MLEPPAGVRATSTTVDNMETLRKPTPHPGTHFPVPHLMRAETGAGAAGRVAPWGWTKGKGQKGFRCRCSSGILPKRRAANVQAGPGAGAPFQGARAIKLPAVLDPLRARGRRRRLRQHICLQVRSDTTTF